MENLVIRYDGKIAYWQTNKHKIIPSMIKYAQNGHIALDEAFTKTVDITKAINEHMYKVANS